MQVGDPITMFVLVLLLGQRRQVVASESAPETWREAIAGLERR